MGIERISKDKMSVETESAQVLYVHPAKFGVEFEQGEQPVGRPYGLIPMGVVALVNVLRENGIPVIGLNFAMERLIDSRFELGAWLKAQPDVRAILIDLHWYEHSYGAISIARACKEALPDVPIVIGGLTSSAFSAEILSDHPEIDYLIRGDAEVPLLALVQGLLQEGAVIAPLLENVPNLSYRQDGHVVENELSYCATTEDLDRLNFVDLDFLLHEDQYYVHEYIVTDLEMARSSGDKSMYRGRWLCNARGCQYNCYFCGGCKSAHKLLAGRNGVVPRSPAALVDDIERLAANRVIQVSFSYDIIEFGEAYWRELFAGLRQRRVKIGLYNELFHMPDPEFVREFAEVADITHSCIALSPLSGNAEVRRINGKYFSEDEFFDTLDLLNMYNMPILVYFSLNLLGENEETIYESIDLAERVYDFYPSSLLKIINSLHTLDPCSPLSERPERYGVEKSLFTFQDYYDYCKATFLNDPRSRTEAHRGFAPLKSRAIEAMSDAWDAARLGRESSWWPIPPGW
jgi:radical SAM superfamily enzyme YgiQ (UPF0313 family)